MYPKRLAKRPHFETIEEFQKFLFKCSLAISLVTIATFIIIAKAIS